MEIEPRKLESGWFLRCLKNSITLSQRMPVAWLLIYGVPPLVSLYMQSTPGLMLLAYFVIVAGLVLAFKCDSHAKKSVVQIISPLFGAFGYIVVVLSAIWIVSWLTGSSREGNVFQVEEDWLFSRFALASMFLIMIMAFIAKVLMFLEIPFKLASLFNPALDINLHAVGIFSLHLTLDHGMGMAAAGEQSREAVTLNLLRFLPLAILGWVSVMIPPLLGICIPFSYCMYREIFYGKGLAETNVVAESANSVALIESTSGPA